MSNIIPSSTPAEVLKIAPENLEIANAYLTLQDISKVAHNLGLPTDTVSSVLDRKEVRAYIHNVFMDFGFNNQFKLRDLIDQVLIKKLKELDEADIGSQKDILEIIALSHKMTMETMDRQIKLETARAGGPKNQTNVQLNSYGGGNYGSLIEKLISNEKTL